MRSCEHLKNLTPCRLKLKIQEGPPSQEGWVDSNWFAGSCICPGDRVVPDGSGSKESRFVGIRHFSALCSLVDRAWE